MKLRAALENIDAIAAVKGVTLFFIGPFDLSADLVYAGQFDHPTVVETIKTIENAVKQAGKPLATIVLPGQDPAALRARGYSLLITGSDVAMLRAAPPGPGPRDIIVINAQANCGAGLVGDNMGHRAHNVGAVGFIIDGAVRDVDELDAIGLSVYARAVSPRQGMRRFVTTAVDQPILCGSVRICPGDVIVADESSNHGMTGAASLPCGAGQRA